MPCASSSASIAWRKATTKGQELRVIWHFITSSLWVNHKQMSSHSFYRCTPPQWPYTKLSLNLLYDWGADFQLWFKGFNKGIAVAQAFYPPFWEAQNKLDNWLTSSFEAHSLVIPRQICICIWWLLTGVPNIRSKEMMRVKRSLLGWKNDSKNFKSGQIDHLLCS